jgi:serine protease AprX
MRRSLGLSLALCLALALSMPAPASAASSRDPRRTAPPVPAHRDVNATGVGDGLESRMRGRPLENRYDVVVTTDGSVGVAASKRAVGDFRVLRRLPIVDGFSATVSGGQAVALARMPGVERVEANVVVHATMDAARADFGVDRARADFGLTGAGVGACVLDTGVDPNHEQLDSKTILFQDFVAAATDPYDDHGHGTHVASILLGDGTGGPNAGRFGGVAPAASLVAGKVLDANGSGTTDDIVAAIEWCAGLPSVDVISMSLGSMFGSDGTDALSEAVNAAVAGGTIAVVAAGNSSDAPYSIGSPGAATGAITIGAAADWSAAPGAPNHSDGVSLAFFSSRGPTLDDRTKPDVVAPGVTITAAEQGTATGYVTYSGTSMATPFAAGAIALALQSEPAWTPAQMRSAIESTAQDRGAPGIDDDWGAGLLDVYALTALAEGLPNAETAFPAHTHVSAVVQNDGLWTYQFVLGGGDLDVPIAATILVDGTCTFFFPGFGCLDSNWSPDLDSRLTDPDGIVLDESMCALGNECGIGRQETLHAMPTVAGTHTIEVPVRRQPERRDGWLVRVRSVARAGRLRAAAPPAATAATRDDARRRSRRRERAGHRQALGGPRHDPRARRRRDAPGRRTGAGSLELELHHRLVHHERERRVQDRQAVGQLARTGHADGGVARLVGSGVPVDGRPRPGRRERRHGHRRHAPVAPQHRDLRVRGHGCLEALIRDRC